MTTHDGLLAALKAIPDLYAAARELLPPGQGNASEVHVQQVYAPLPINAEAEAVTRETYDVVTSWAQLMRTRLGLRMRDTRRESVAVAEDCLFLRGCVGALLEWPTLTVQRWRDYNVTGVQMSGRDAGNEITRVQRRLLAFTGGTDRRRRAPAPCPRCGGTLWKNVTQQRVECDPCKVMFTEVEYQATVAAYAASIGGNAE